MAKVDAELRKAWRNNPSADFDLIIHTEGNLGERSKSLEDLGVEIKRRFRLTGGASVRCTGRTALKLARRSWITRIETDRPVSALGR
ncbi:MAG: hypothetical protein U9R48_03130 [Chloroflexota bacterium]|nr:hypothetical protein [Chloroflexota bacterium]